MRLILTEVYTPLQKLPVNVEWKMLHHYCLVWSIMQSDCHQWEISLKKWISRSDHLLSLSISYKIVCYFTLLWEASKPVLKHANTKNILLKYSNLWIECVTMKKDILLSNVRSECIWIITFGETFVTRQKAVSFCYQHETLTLLLIFTSAFRLMAWMLMKLNGQVHFPSQECFKISQPFLKIAD